MLKNYFSIIIFSLINDLNGIVTSKQL